MTDRAYHVHELDLTNAPASPGFVTIHAVAEKIAFADARDATGVLQPGALVEISLGRSVDDYIPFRLGDQITSRMSNSATRVRWDAQAGVTAKPLVFGSAAFFDYQARPAATLVVGDLANTASNAAVSVTTTATLIQAANGNRRELVVVNNGGVTVFLGPAGVTAAAGLPLAPGRERTLSNFNGALYGITSAGTSDVRALEQAAT